MHVWHFPLLLPLELKEQRDCTSSGRAVGGSIDASIFYYYFLSSLYQEGLDDLRVLTERGKRQLFVSIFCLYFSVNDWPSFNFGSLVYRWKEYQLKDLSLFPRQMICWLGRKEPCLEISRTKHKFMTCELYCTCTFELGYFYGWTNTCFIYNCLNLKSKLNFWSIKDCFNFLPCKKVKLQFNTWLQA